MTRHYMGIDVGASRIRLVQMARARSGWTIECAGEQEIPKATSTKERCEAIIVALKSLMQAGAFRPDVPAAVAMPDGEVFFHALNTDLLSLDDVRRVAKFETEGDFPFPPDDLVIDIAGALKSTEERQNVLMGAVRRDSLDEFVGAFRAAGMECTRVDAAAGALVRLTVRHDQEEKPSILLYLSEQQTILTVTYKGQLLTVRSLHVADEPAACVQTLALEMDLCWRALFGAPLPTGVRCVLGGDPKLTTGLAEALAKEAGLSVTALNFMAGVTVPANIHVDASYALSIVLARNMAEANAGMNFLTAEKGAGRKAAQTRKALIVTGILACAIAATWGAGLLLKLNALTSQRRGMQSETDQIVRRIIPSAQGGERVQDALLRIESRLADTRKEFAVFKPLARTENSPLNVLQLISARMPETVRAKISELSIADQTVRMVGATDTFKSVDAIKNQLQTAPEFAGVTLAEVGADRGSQAVRFVAVITLRAR